MIITCEFCHHDFEPQDPQKRLIERLESSENGGLVMLECPNCFKDIEFRVGDKGNSNPYTYRCPVIGCTGWVSFITEQADEKFWGCGECGSIWYKEENLYKYISESISKYQYRSSCYKKIENSFIPGEESEEASNYEDLVEREPKEFGDEFVKG